MTAIISVAVFVVAYMLIATERVPKVSTALAGAGVILGLGVSSAEDAFFSPETGVDWDVIFLLLGMMIIVRVLRRTGVFEYVAIWAAKRAKGSPLRVMMLLVLITALASAFLDNVTTVLLIAPVTLLVCDRLAISPVPFLIAEVFASNIGGAATLIGDPPNIIIASRSGLSFNDFLINMAPMAALALAAFVAMLPLLFRGSFPSTRAGGRRDGPERAGGDQGPPAAGHLRHRAGRGVHRLHRPHRVPHRAVGRGPARRRCAGAAVPQPARDVMPGVEWETLVFFAGLFIMVGALVKTGVIGRRRRGRRATGGDALTGAMLILFVSALLSGIVDNIPYVAAMSPVVRTDRGHRRPGPGRGAVVVAGDRRRLRRQPDRDRRQRQRRRPRHRPPVRLTDLLLGVHPQGRRRDRGDHPAGGALPLAALLLTARRPPAAGPLDADLLHHSAQLVDGHVKSRGSHSGWPDLVQVVAFPAGVFTVVDNRRHSGCGDLEPLAVGVADLVDHQADLAAGRVLTDLVELGHPDGDLVIVHGVADHDRARASAG